MQIRSLLQRNTEELTGVMRALNGEYIQPEAGGDLLRDGAGVLPTGAALLSSLGSEAVQRANVCLAVVRRLAWVAWACLKPSYAGQARTWNLQSSLRHEHPLKDMVQEEL